MASPFYKILPAPVLNEDQLMSLRQITDKERPEIKNFGRRTYWDENFLYHQGKFYHQTKSPYKSAIDSVSQIFLKCLSDSGVDINKSTIALGAYLDRNVVNVSNAATSDLFWHRDSINVDEQSKDADYSLVLLLSPVTWKGADIILQMGGSYDKEEGVWINSDSPKIPIKHAHNQAIVFHNRDSAHYVTAVELLNEETVHRDIFILTCFFK